MKKIKLLVILSFIFFNVNLITVQAVTTSEIELAKSDFAQEYFSYYLSETNKTMESTYAIPAGAFLDEEFNLHILAKADENIINTLNNKYGLNKLFDHSQINVYIEKAHYSENEILDAYQSIIDSELSQKGYLNAVSVNYEINGVNIEFSPTKISEKELATLLKNLLGDFSNFDLIAREIYGVAEEKYNIYGGARIEGWMSGDPKSCSLGFAATTFDNKVGFVTAGHCFDLNSDVQYLDPVDNTLDTIGKVTARKYEKTADAEFVKLNSGFWTPNAAKWSYWTFPYTTYIKSQSERPIQGAAISIFGYNDRYITTILSNDATVWYIWPISTIWEHMLKYAEVTVDGDSGGVIISNQKAVGIVRGSSGGYDYATPADTIVIKLGLAY